MKTAIYLRKSRAEEDMDQGQVLKRHRDTLLSFAEKQKLDIVAIKEEIASGASFDNRPKIQELLDEVKDNLYDAVLVMDFDRLSRGDMLEQGIILKTFKDNKAAIITPSKTYDLDNDFDELNIELLGFLSRQEYRTIRKRMQRGINKSIDEGFFMAKAPFGYIKKDKLLYINDVEAAHVRAIFNNYVSGNGARIIANKLNMQGLRNKAGNPIENDFILRVIQNPIYIGKIAWHRRCKVKGENKIMRNPESEWKITDGRHEPIIDDDLFNKANDIRRNKYHPPTRNNTLRNPFAGLLRCETCDRAYVLGGHRKVEKEYFLRCGKGCGNCSIRLYKFETMFLDVFESDIKKIAYTYTHTSLKNTIDFDAEINALRLNLAKIKKRKIKLYSLLEDGIYEKDTFLERMNTNTKEINDINSMIDQLVRDKEDNENTAHVPTFIDMSKIAITLYKKLDRAQDKNDLLKSIIQDIYITKTNHTDINLTVTYKL